MSDDFAIISASVLIVIGFISCVLVWDANRQIDALFKQMKPLVFTQKRQSPLTAKEIQLIESQGRFDAARDVLEGFTSSNPHRRHSQASAVWAVSYAQEMDSLLRRAA